MNRLAILPYLYSTNFNIILYEVFFSFGKARESMKLYLLKGSLISKAMKLFHGLHFLASLRSIRDIENCYKSKSTGTSYNISNVILFTDIMKEKISFRNLFIHCKI